MNRSREYGYQFLRPVIIDYVQARLAEGASVATVRLEMAAIRGLFAYMIAMGAYDVMLNPAKNVKVRKNESRAPERAGSQEKAAAAGTVNVGFSERVF
jgi:site-specific recombinase XerD